MNQTVGLDALQELYDKWFDMRLKDIDKLEEIKSEIDVIVKHLKGYIFTYPDYWLISLGHDLMLNKLDEAAVSLDQLEHFDTDKLNDRYQFYYYLFKGTYFLLKGDNNYALNNLQKAKEKLVFSPSNIESAEYYLKLGTVYYHVKKTIDSLHNISTALSLYKSEPGYEKRIVACEIALGLNSIDLHQWEEAEERFYSALNFANKAGDKPMQAVIYHDLGLLYAEQNMSKAAIHWLTESLSDVSPNYRTIYLMTREYFKLGQKAEATKWLESGTELVKKLNLAPYIIRFNLLKVLYLEDNKEVIEEALKNGIQYFLNENGWNYVEENAKYLADFYAKEKRYEEAVTYYQMMIQAQQKISEMEALK